MTYNDYHLHCLPKVTQRYPGALTWRYPGALTQHQSYLPTRERRKMAVDFGEFGQTRRTRGSFFAGESQVTNKYAGKHMLPRLQRGLPADL